MCVSENEYSLFAVENPLCDDYFCHHVWECSHLHMCGVRDKKKYMLRQFVTCVSDFLSVKNHVIFCKYKYMYSQVLVIPQHQHAWNTLEFVHET